MGTTGGSMIYMPQAVSDYLSGLGSPGGVTPEVQAAADEYNAQVAALTPEGTDQAFATQAPLYFASLYNPSSLTSRTDYIGEMARDNAPQFTQAGAGWFSTNAAGETVYPLAGFGEYLDQNIGPGWEQEYNRLALQHARSGTGAQNVIGVVPNTARAAALVDLLNQYGITGAPLQTAMDIQSGMNTYFGKINDAAEEAKKKEQIAAAIQAVGFLATAAGVGVGLEGLISGATAGAGAGAGGAMDMGVGFGGDTLNAIGLGGSDFGMFGNLANTWNSLSPLQQKLATQAGKFGLQAASGQDIDPMSAAFAVAGPLADAGWSSMGGWDGFQLPDFGGIDAAPPVGYMSDLDLGGYADMAPSEDFGSLFSSSSFINASPEMQAQLQQSLAALDTEGVYNVTDPAILQMIEDVQAGILPADFYAAPDASGAGEFGEGDYAAQEGATMQSVDEPIPAGQETFGDDYGAEAPAAGTETGFNIKPSTILQVAKTLFGLLGGEGKAQEKALRKVTEREYANEEERSAAYYAYAQELLGYVPSVSEAYAMDPQNVNTQFGSTFIDPETGEVRYELTPGTQAYHDALMKGAKDALDAGLGVDTDQLTAEQLGKAIASLQGKRDKDMATLTRALYARGLLGLVTYQGAGKNLLTGETETWSLEEGQGANPYFAAEMARRERENYDLAKLSRGEAENYMTKLLNHSGGLFGKAKDVDQQMIEALFQAGERTDEAGNVKKRKGKGLFDLVAGPGGAYMQQLMGSLPSGKAAAGLADADLIEAAMREEAIRRFMEEQGN